MVNNDFEIVYSWSIGLGAAVTTKWFEGILQPQCSNFFCDCWRTDKNDQNVMLVLNHLQGKISSQTLVYGHVVTKESDCPIGWVGATLFPKMQEFVLWTFHHDRER